MKMRRIPSRVYEIYERLFELKQGERSVLEFYGESKSLIDELKMHQPAVTDASTLRGFHQDLAMSKFVSGLSPSLRSQMRSQILGGDSIYCAATFSRVMRVFTGADVSPAPSVEQFAMASERGRGRGHDRDFRGRVSFEDVNPMVAGKVALIRGPDNESIARGISISLRSAGRSLVALNGHNRLILTFLHLVVLFMLLYSLPLALSLCCYHRMSMTDCVSSSSLRPVIDSCIPFTYEYLYCISSKTLDIRLSSLIPHDMY